MKKRVTFTFDIELIEKLKEISDKTMIPQSRIAETAIKNYIKNLEKADK
jgi:predicted transcriptional regulator